jgi:hypothetical protein
LGFFRIWFFIVVWRFQFVLFILGFLIWAFYQIWAFGSMHYGLFCIWAFYLVGLMNLGFLNCAFDIGLFTLFGLSIEFNLGFFCT